MYKARVGETVTLRLVATEGSIVDVDTIICKMKKAGPRNTVPPASSPVIATFTTQNIFNGWDFVLGPEISSTLEPGNYIADATIILVGGEVDKTSPVVVEILPSVS